ncbi:MAG: type IV toxin-antitoxin system AbiEi family antitoxin domain-containing protein [Coxiellaceae bacterium]|nr:type IV toxin-antitoxin system AbiEi family antitoxin domain-containing protein [Coxiellaceae bacterium]
MKLAPKDSVLTTLWLLDHGVSHKLAWWYVKSGWFERIAEGAYCFSGAKISWASAIVAIQQQCRLPIYPGGKTALQLLGKSHFINMELKSIQLFADRKSRIPTWLKAPFWEGAFDIFRPKLFTSDDVSWLATLDVGGHQLLVSTPEKASIELCYLVPNKVTFSEASLILEGLPRMRSKIIQSLLESCRSYKAKRLLLYLAEHYQHPWYSELNLKRIDLGAGKYVIAGGRKYINKYKISIPILEEDK